MRISLGLFLRLLRGLAGVLLGAFPGGEEHIRHAVADAALRLLHHVAVDAGGGGHAAEAQPVADAHAVHPVEKQHAGHGVAEGVGVQVGEAVALLL